MFCREETFVTVQLLSQIYAVLSVKFQEPQNAVVYVRICAFLLLNLSDGQNGGGGVIPEFWELLLPSPFPSRQTNLASTES